MSLPFATLATGVLASSGSHLSRVTTVTREAERRKQADDFDQRLHLATWKSYEFKVSKNKNKRRENMKQRAGGMIDLCIRRLPPALVISAAGG